MACGGPWGRTAERDRTEARRVLAWTMSRILILTYIYMWTYNDLTMATRKLYSFWIDPDLLEGLKALKERVGVNPSETVRRALRAWLEQHEAIVKSGRKRAATRRRP
jgi:Ribbon-helix-helix protein, copG family